MSVFSSVKPGMATGGLHGLLLIAATTAVSLPDLTLQWFVLWKIHLGWDVEGPSLSLLLSVVSLFFFLYTEKNKGKVTPDMVHNCVADLLDLPLQVGRLRFPM